jgi:ATP-dependent helicase HepA
MQQQQSSTLTQPQFSPGQRWISTAEPELGLGTIVSCSNRRVEISFTTHAAKRLYAFDGAPLQRIIFAPGNTIAATDGKYHTVAAIETDPANGLVTYQCGSVSLREDILADTIAFSTPQQRLAAGIADDISAFTLRSEAVKYRAACTASPVRGFAAGRIDLIPHQLYIADRAMSRSKVRVLLADETGLGKTIEACLILHRMLLTGQVTRAMILVPDSLVHQWFVELLRRFNLTFRILTADMYTGGDLSSPFDEDPLWICSTTMLRRHRIIADQLLASQWDMVIVDEAHHITTGDPLFPALQTLGAGCRSLVLLSATPEQFGRKGHFARLKLLDPLRYREMEPADRESQRLHLVASCIEAAIGNGVRELTDKTSVTLPDELYAHLTSRMKSIGIDNGELPRTLTIGHLVDLFGAGRAYFRNTRRTITGFPERVANIVLLEPPQAPDDDPHARWIAAFAKKYPQRKILVITSTIEAATAIRDNIQKLVAVDIGLFHEAMTLIQRDRQAAWFAEENGARLLVCSELGSEGRNFQFCSDLVMLSLPWNPELLEQRIGRLDRIGQKRTINLHIPVLPKTPEEALCRWYHEGVGAFEKNIPAAATVFEELRLRLEEAAAAFAENPRLLADVIEDAKKLTASLSADLFEHRDFLLEFASNNPQRARTLITAICREAEEHHTAAMMQRLFNHFGIKLEEAGNERFALITEYCTDHAFPLPRSERPVITYDRTTACSHDTIEFLTPDHPMVTGAVDLYLSSAHGTTSFALWNDATVSEVLLESLYIVECIAPPELRLFRFFTAQPLRLVVNHMSQLVTQRYPPLVFDANCKNGPVGKLLTQKQLIQGTFPKMAEASDRFAQDLVMPMIVAAKDAVHRTCSEERERLSLLRSQGAPVTAEELDELDNEESLIVRHLDAMRLRRDALRLIWRGQVRRG